VARAAEGASSNVHTVATAAEELTSSVGEISRQVHESARIAGEAVRDADQTAEKVRHLAQGAQKIGDIVDLINTIVGQTILHETRIFNHLGCQTWPKASADAKSQFPTL